MRCTLVRDCCWYSSHRALSSTRTCRDAHIGDWAQTACPCPPPISDFLPRIARALTGPPVSVRGLCETLLPSRSHLRSSSSRHLLTNVDALRPSATPTYCVPSDFSHRKVVFSRLAKSWLVTITVNQTRRSFISTRPQKGASPRRWSAFTVHC